MKISTLLSSCLVAGLVLIAPLGYAVTEHDNVVEFHSQPGDEYSQVTSLVFYFDGNYSITSGQPWDGVTTNNVSADYPAYQADALAGRHSSDPPSTFFTQRAGGEWITTDGQPGIAGMNFAFTGSLEIDGSDYSIVLGQNMCGSRNCWYLGANQSGFKVDTNGWLLTPDGQYRIKPSTNDDVYNEFQVFNY